MKTTPSIRHCPVCGLAMQASKSRDDLRQPDTFSCLSCGSQIVTQAARPSPGQVGVAAPRKAAAE
jgi:transcription elongation factor Elf1